MNTETPQENEGSNSVPSKNYGLPRLIQAGLKTFSDDAERHIYLRTTIAAISGLCSNTSGSYDNKTVYPNHYFALVAPPANGKGIIKYARVQLIGVHNYFKAMSSAEYSAHADAFVKRFNSNPLPHVDLKTSPRVLIATDITKSMLVLQLAANHSAPSIMLTDEIDSLAASMLGEHGRGLGAVLRMAFQGETITQQLKTNRENLEVENPKLSCVLAGTPNQMVKLAGNVENGMLSRFSMLYMDLPPLWKNVATTDQYRVREAVMAENSELLLKFYLHQLEYPLFVKLTEQQWHRINSWGREMNMQLAIGDNEELISLARRHGLIWFKMSLTLAALRRFECGSTDSEVFCEDDDFDMAEILVQSSLQSALAFAAKLEPKNENTRKAQLEAMLSGLPEEFTRGQAQESAKKVKMSPRTTDRLLSVLVNGGKLTKTGHGNYVKKSKNEYK